MSLASKQKPLRALVAVGCGGMAFGLRGQDLTAPGNPHSTKSVWEYPHTGEPLIPPVAPLLNIGLRDTAICRGPDDTFYLTGTIGPDFMVANEGIRVWRSHDLKTWDDLGLVWTFERD